MRRLFLTLAISILIVLGGALVPDRDGPGEFKRTAPQWTADPFHPA